MKLILNIYQDGSLISEKAFEQGTFRIGRSEFCDVVLKDDEVNRSAIELRVLESSVQITNMGARGKIKINGKRQETGEIQNGASVEIARFKLVFSFGAAISGVQASEPVQPMEPVQALDSQGNPLEAMAESPLFGETPESPPESEKVPSPEENPLEVAAVQSQGFFAGSDSDEKEKVFPFQPDPNPVSPAGRTAISGNLALKERTETFSKALVAKLVFIEGPRAGEELTLQSFELSFGRSGKADVVIKDHKLSRIHAKIVRFGNGYRVMDLNSHNGTRVNGVRILEHPLSSFDVIEFGNTKIKFLIHDLVAPEKDSRPNLAVATSASKEITRSLHFSETERRELAKLESPETVQPQESFVPAGVPNAELDDNHQRKKRLKLIGLVGLGIVLSLWLLSDPTAKKEKEQNPKASIASTAKPAEKIAATPKVPADFAELSEEMQRKIEGLYNSALATQQKTELTLDEIQKAREGLRNIHQSLSHYKNSQELLEQLDKRYKDKMMQIASEKAKKDEAQDLNIYLEDGLESLKRGDFDRASEYFTLALNLDPRNPIAIKGIRAAEARVRDLENIPVESDPELEKRKKIKELFEKALVALNNRAYQEAIEVAERIRKISLKGDATYLNEAKQIIDRAKIGQKEEFEPFLIQAKEKFAEGDYNASRDLCEEMLKRDPAYDEAKELLLKTKKNLNRLAKEAYTHGYILESIGQLEQAKQYWNRAKNYVREGDEYFDKINRKLDQYP